MFVKTCTKFVNFDEQVYEIGPLHGPFHWIRKRIIKYKPSKYADDNSASTLLHYVCCISLYLVHAH